jgi:hypothetical protein
MLQFPKTQGPKTQRISNSQIPIAAPWREVGPRAQRELPEGNIGRWWHGFLDILVFGVATDAHNPPVGSPRADRPVERVFVRKIFSSKSFVDHDDFGRAVAIGGAQPAPAQHRDAHNG